MAKESVLTQQEKEAFTIERFIFHIIIESQPAPIYLEEVTLAEDQILFFKQRFIEISEGIQHVFVDPENSDFVKNCQKLIKDPEQEFIRISKLLSASFKSHHKKSTVDGVFISSLVKTLGDRYLIFLLKLDNRKVYQYKTKNSKALLREIKDTFIEDKKAIQKSALVDISEHYSWDVLAKERNPGKDNRIRSYFADFLTVKEKDTPAKLTQKALSSVRKWAIANRAELDPANDISTYKNRAINYLSNTPIFKVEDFITFVVNDDDELRMDTLFRSLKDSCDQDGLSGQSFKPNAGSLSNALKKNIRKTNEGVRIEWFGETQDSLITIPKEKDKNDNLFHILIRTSSIEILD